MPQRAPGRQEKWLYTVTQVEEVKRMLGFVPIMIATIVFNTGDPLRPPPVEILDIYKLNLARLAGGGIKC